MVHSWIRHQKWYLQTVNTKHHYTAGNDPRGKLQDSIVDDQLLCQKTAIRVHDTHTFKIQNTVKKAAKELKMQKSKTIKASQCVRSSENCSLESRPNGQFNFRSWIRWEKTLAVIFLRTNVRWSASSFFSQQDKNITALLRQSTTYT